MSKNDIPDKVGKYEVRGLVGRGAMGVVYSAVDPGLGRLVAIKTMSMADSPHEAELRLRFLREAKRQDSPSTRTSSPLTSCSRKVTPPIW